MTTKIKDKMLKLKRNVKVQIRFMLISLIVIVLGFAAAIIAAIKENNLTCLISYFTVIIMNVLNEIMFNIRRRSEEIIKNNKIRHIILSDFSTVMFFLYFIVFNPIRWYLNITIVNDSATEGKLLLSTVAIAVILAILISDKAKKKLSN